MFPNVKAELARNGMTQKDLAETIGVRPATMSLKLSGNAPITLKEAFQIQKALHTRLSIDALFRVTEGEKWLSTF